MNTKQIDLPVLNIFGQLLNQTHDLFVVFDANWNFVFANIKACNYFFDGQTFAGKNLLQDFPFYSNSKFFSYISKSRDAGKPTEFEELSPFSKRWLHFRLYPLDELLAVYATDINLRKEALRTIQQNQERYYNFISQSSEGIWRYEVEDPIPVHLPPTEQVDRIYQDAYLAECNDAMAKMYGFHDAYDLMGSRLEMLLPKNEENTGYLQAFIESGYKLTDAESIEVAKDGSTKYMLNNLIGIVENGLLVRAWGTQRDITQLKEAEEKLKLAQEELSLALTAGSAGTFVWNLQTNEVVWSKEVEALYGWPQHNLGGKLEGWMKSVHPEDLSAAMEAMNHAINSKSPLHTEYRIVWPDGTVRRILSKGKVFYNAEGRPERMIGINIEISTPNT